MSFIDLLLPEGEMQRFVRLVMSLVVVLLLLQPLAALTGHGGDFERLLVALAPVTATVTPGPTKQAERLTQAGLTALTQLELEEIERSLSQFCTEELSSEVTRVKVTEGSDGNPRITLWLRQKNLEQRVRAIISDRYKLPPAAIEVVLDGR